MKQCSASGPGWGCANRAIRRGLCETHWSQFKVGTPLRPPGKYVRQRTDVPEGFAHCTECDEILPQDRFGKHRSGRNGYAIICKECRKAHQLNRKYGVGATEFKAKALERQGHRCAICKTDDPGHGHNTFALDHCHETGRWRGMLCHRCNLLLASLERIDFETEPYRRYVEGANKNLTEGKQAV